jgi:hypothetical protein
MSCRFFEIGAPPLLAFALALLPAARAASGKLEDVKDATADDGDDQGDEDGDDSDDDDGAGDAIAEAVFAALGHAIVDAAQERAEHVRFGLYPYADGAAGWVVREGAAAALPIASFRFSLDYAYDWDRVHRPAVTLALDTAAGVGLRAELTNYFERLPGGALDYLAIGTLNAMFRVVDTPRVAPYVGLGWRYLAAEGAMRNGFDCLFAADVFPVRPLVVSAIAEGGNLGRAGFLHGRLTLGALVQRLEIFAGYDAVIIGDGEDPVIFHGPVAGIRGWL